MAKEYVDYLIEEQTNLGDLVKCHCKKCKKVFWATEKMAEAIQEGIEPETCQECEK